jgi:hypothetical protein
MLTPPFDDTPPEGLATSPTSMTWPPWMPNDQR